MFVDMQIQGKVMQQFKHLSAANYVTAVKSRLMGLGVSLLSSSRVRDNVITAFQSSTMP